MPTGFLSLPIELRLHIYDYALISRRKSIILRSDMEWDKETLVLIDGGMNGKTSWSINTLISPALLRTCRTIYSEASSILYTENVFLMMDPQDMIAFLKKIGSTNTKYLKYLRLWVFPGLLYPWLKLLDNLAHKVTRLRKIEIVFIPDRLQPGARWKKRGLGDNEYFVRALAKIQGLSELGIRGYYAQHWLAYMEKNMGVSVHAKIGFFEKPSRYDVKAFKQYQQDLGDLTL